MSSPRQPSGHSSEPALMRSLSWAELPSGGPEALIYSPMWHLQGPPICFEHDFTTCCSLKPCEHGRKMETSHSSPRVQLSGPRQSLRGPALFPAGSRFWGCSDPHVARRAKEAVIGIFIGLICVYLGPIRVNEDCECLCVLREAHQLCDQVLIRGSVIPSHGPHPESQGDSKTG